MDDKAALIARRAAAVSEWNVCRAPTMETLAADDSELLGELADVEPQPLAALLPDVTRPMLRQARAKH